MVEIIEVKEINRHLFLQIESLIAQLATKELLPTYERLSEIVESKNSQLFIAVDKSKGEMTTVVGTATLGSYLIPTGHRFWIEDVVVDEHYRGRGLGKELVIKALDMAYNRGAVEVRLTSRPAREVANTLYLSMGFERVATNLYKLRLIK